MKRKTKRLCIAALVACLLFSSSACSFSELSANIQQKIGSEDAQDDDLFDEAFDADEDGDGAVDNRTTDKKRTPKLSVKKLFGRKDQESAETKKSDDGDSASSVSNETFADRKTAEPAEGTTAPSRIIPKEQQVYDVFRNMRNQYRKWFMPNNVTLDMSDSQSVSITDAYGGSYTAEAYRVREDGVNSKADVDNLFLSCCDRSYYDSFQTMSVRNECYGGQIRYADINGQLYQVADDIIVRSDEENSITVTKITDQDFEIQFYEILYVASSGAGSGDYYHYSSTLHYRFKDNRYVFCDFVRTEIIRD